ncbi:MAG: S28 family serine protease [Bacteriovoracaceae bacterium]|nr:S28 family serine protease [Bacteriovoracaceae bacterium]
MRGLICFFALCKFLSPQHVYADVKTFLFEKKLNQSFFSPKSKENLLTEEGQDFDQKINHHSLRSKTFKQKYFVDSTLALSSDSPVLYVVCGEGECEGASGSPLVNSLAEKIHAHRVALEHRYYGKSQPFETLDRQNLKYLSMEQALADLANFEKYAQTELGLKGKWIVIGGSYAGEVAAFYRMKYPDLVVGALASSAPVKAKADFEEYDQYVAKVAGPKCLNAIQTAVKLVETNLKDPQGKLNVKKIFNSLEVKDDVDFLYVVADMAAIAIQYGYQQKFCTAVTSGLDNGRLLESYAAVGLSLLNAFGMTPVKDSFQGAESIYPKDYLGWVGLRSWMYQSCTEFGFYQIASPDPKTSARSAQLSLKYHDQVCERLFGIKETVNTTRTNKEYYWQLFNSETKNIFFTNGANDPWSTLSITQGSESESGARNESLVIAKIADAAHCDDLGGRDSLALRAVRNQFFDLANSWLDE